MPSIAPGSSAAISCATMGTRPKWIKWTAAGTAGGTAELPSGHRRLVSLSGSTRAETDYYVTPESVGSTSGQWEAIIYAPNGSHISADGLAGFPTIGTPMVRLQADAPAKAVLTIPAKRNGGILSSTFDGWSDGHTGAVSRGMELTVEYRKPDGNMAMVFRGQIYQIQSGETITITAYDRLMDLYQYSDQYQSHEGYNEEALALASVTANDYTYTASQAPGTIVNAQVKSEISIDALANMTDGVIDNPYLPQYSNYWILCSMPAYAGVSPKPGDTIKTVGVPYKITGSAGQSGKATAKVALFRIVDNTVYRLTDWTANQTVQAEATQAGAMYFNVSWTMQYATAETFIGIIWTGNARGGLGVSLSSAATVGTYLHKTTTGYNNASTPLGDWTAGAPVNTYNQAFYVEPTVYYENIDQITTGYITVSGTTIYVPKNRVTTPSGTYISTPVPAFELDVAYQILGGTNIATVVEDLIKAAGCKADIPAGALLGQTTYYTSSTFDYMTCVQELIKGGNFGIRASVSEPGKLEVYPRNTIDDTAVASFSTRPGGSAEHSIVSHNLTAHWMAEKATQAILAENVTSSGLPIALETDDALMGGSLCRTLQSPLRGITADSSMGTHLLLATSAGGKMVQLHTNVYEGEITLAGYRADIWNLAGAHTGGKPVTIEVPEYGAQGKAVPTAVEFGGGVTRVSLDNIRTADRSEIARSMGLTGDAISNTARTLPKASYVFARYDDYTAQQSGITPGTVTLVEFLQDGGTVLASQNDANYIKTVEDAAGYLHVCAVLPISNTGYAATTPISSVRFTMGGTARTAVLDNPKYALGGQALHADIRMRKA